MGYWNEVFFGRRNNPYYWTYDGKFRGMGNWTVPPTTGPLRARWYATHESARRAHAAILKRPEVTEVTVRQPLLLTERTK